MLSLSSPSWTSSRWSCVALPFGRQPSKKNTSVAVILGSLCSLYLCCVCVHTQVSARRIQNYPLLLKRIKMRSQPKPKRGSKSYPCEKFLFFLSLFDSLIFKKKDSLTTTSVFNTCRKEDTKEADSEKEAAMEAELRAARERAIVPLEARMTQFKDMLLERGVTHPFFKKKSLFERTCWDFLSIAHARKCQIFQAFVRHVVTV